MRDPANADRNIDRLLGCMTHELIGLDWIGLDWIGLDC